MTNYVSFDPNVEVIGANLRSFLENTHREDIQPMLEKHGLTEVQPDLWYRLQPWLDVLSEIAQRGGAMFDFVSIGMAVSETAMLPPEVEKMSFADFMANLDAFYQMQHRGGDAGSLKVTRVGPQHLRIDVCVPYPDDLEYGTAYGFAKRFLPPHTHFVVRYDDTVKRRDEGGDVTVIHIEW